MKISKQDFSDIKSDIEELQDLLTDRISDLHEIKGMMQARHAYIFYRKLLYGINDKLNNAVKAESI